MNQISQDDLNAMQNAYLKLKESQLPSATAQGIAALKSLVQFLRKPETGCPWDQKQDHHSFVKCILEEAQEVNESIEKNDMENLKEEIGDLLFSLLFMIELSEEKKIFTFNDVLERVLKKLVFRHPHVFGNNPPKNISAEKAYELFQDVKKLEKNGTLKY